MSLVALVCEHNPVRVRKPVSHIACEVQAPKPQNYTACYYAENSGPGNTVPFVSTPRKSAVKIHGKRSKGVHPYSSLT